MNFFEKKITLGLKKMKRLSMINKYFIRIRLIMVFIPMYLNRKYTIFRNG